jgi:hypothetical protein
VTKLRYFAGINHDPFLEENILAGKNSQRAVGNPEMEFGGKTDICKSLVIWQEETNILLKNRLFWREKIVNEPSATQRWNLAGRLTFKKKIKSGFRQCVYNIILFLCRQPRAGIGRKT